MEGTRHIPVLLNEVLTCLDIRPGRTYVDGTVGGGGHARAILERSSPSGFLIGLDWDGEAIERARRTLSPFAGRFVLVEENFRYLKSVLHSLSVAAVHGILLDLGLSTDQLEDAERGFSFRAEGPLDMRMDRRLQRSAQDLLKRLPVPELSEILRQYGEERFAHRIARAIERRRRKGPIRTSKELAETVEQSVPYRGRIHPATRTFQALRIAVNDEIQNLRDFLPECAGLLHPGGRLAVISFHSLEDRMVKEQIRKWAKQEGVFRILTPKPLIPTTEEVAANPRARSAKLRAAEKLTEGGQDG